jgi:hypothetical protein
MVSRLLNAGYHVRVYNRTRRRAEDLTRLGTSVAQIPRELAGLADTVLSSVADDNALEQVTFGDEVCAHLRPRGIGDRTNLFACRLVPTRTSQFLKIRDLKVVIVLNDNRRDPTLMLLD